MAWVAQRRNALSPDIMLGQEMIEIESSDERTTSRSFWSVNTVKAQHTHPPSLQELEHIAREVRRDILVTAHRVGGGHVGGSLSCTEILVALYGAIVDATSIRDGSADRARVIFSKGHSSLAMYATLARFDLLDGVDLETFLRTDGRLPGHTEHFHLPTIEITTGSLGHGPSVAAGIALAMDLQNRDVDTFCVVGDGEMNEGSVWEALMFIGQHQLRRLTTIVDANSLMSLDETRRILSIEPLEDRLRSFGLSVISINGNDMKSVLEAVEHARQDPYPCAVVARTVKGSGVSFMENQTMWHYRAPSQSELAAALLELESK